MQTRPPSIEHQRRVRKRLHLHGQRREVTRHAASRGFAVLASIAARMRRCAFSTTVRTSAVAKSWMADALYTMLEIATMKARISSLWLADAIAQCHFTFSAR